MKAKEKRKNNIKNKETRRYTCSRRVNKEGRKIWVVLEDGRKFYRIFKTRSLAISYFTKLKTIYAEMLVQDLKENVFSSIVYTKLETVKKGLIKSFEDFDGGIVEDSDKLFDEELYISDLSESSVVDKKNDDEDKRIDDNEYDMHDFSFVEDLFPKKKPLITPFKINIDTSQSVLLNKTIVSNDFHIRIYQSDLDLSFYVQGDKFYTDRDEIVAAAEKQKKEEMLTK